MASALNRHLVSQTGPQALTSPGVSTRRAMLGLTEGPMTLSRTEEIRQVASEWEFDKRIHAPRAARLLKELLRRG